MTGIGLEITGGERPAAGRPRRVLPGMSTLAAALLVSLLATTSGTAQDQGQSARDGSTKSPSSVQAGEKPARKAKLVITNDDLPSQTGSTADDSASEKAHPTVAHDGTPQPGQGHPSTEAQDANIDHARAAVENLKREEQTLVRRYAEMQRKLQETDDESLRRLYTDSLSRRDETLARKRKQIEDAEQVLRSAETGTKQGGSNAPK